MSTVQHPYADSHQEKIQDIQDTAGYTGYLAVFPAF